VASVAETFGAHVVCPKYRSIGSGAKLVRETLPLVATLYVEMVAVMAKYTRLQRKQKCRK